LNLLKAKPKPNSISDLDYEKLTSQVNVIFNGALGLTALRNKDYATAQKYLRAAVETDPNDIRNVYPLALAYLNANPPNPASGLFFIARCVSLSSGLPAQSPFIDYGKKQYVKYHGSEDGWSDLLQATVRNPLPDRATEAATESKNNSYQAHLRDANALYKAKQLSQATQTATALIKEDPNRWEGYLLMGAIQEDENMPEAKVFFQRAFDLAPDDLKRQIAGQIQSVRQP
jgi:Tfp pilus assembly protein PilF